MAPFAGPPMSRPGEHVLFIGLYKVAAGHANEAHHEDFDWKISGTPSAGVVFALFQVGLYEKTRQGEAGKAKNGHNRKHKMCSMFSKYFDMYVVVIFCVTCGLANSVSAWKQYSQPCELTESTQFPKLIEPLPEPKESDRKKKRMEWLDAICRCWRQHSKVSRTPVISM